MSVGDNGKAKQIASRIAQEDFPLIRQRAGLPSPPRQLDGLPLPVQKYLQDLDKFLRSREMEYPTLLAQVAGLHKELIETRRLVNKAGIKGIVEEVGAETLTQMESLKLEVIHLLGDLKAATVKALEEGVEFGQEQINEAVTRGRDG